MRITKYDTRLSADKLPYLVKENAFNYGKQEKLNSPQTIHQFFKEKEGLVNLDHEIVWLLCFNTRMNLIGYFKISEGLVDTAPVSPREVYIKALAVGSKNIILVHNHPSADATPSEADNQITNTLKDAGTLLNIPLIDHIVLGDGDYYSYREYGWI